MSFPIPQIIPLIPALIDLAARLAEIVSADKQTPEEKKVILEGVSVDLRAMNLRVQAVELPTEGSGA